MITLTDEQQAALDAVRTWCGDWSADQPIQYEAKPFRLFGPAGTGKTTLAKHIAEALGLEYVVFGAYTGKAAQVLRRKGVDASTIHSAIYRPTQSAGLRVRLRELQNAWAEADPEEPLERENILAEIEEIEAELRKPFFELNPGSEWADADLIVLDEVSMVDDAMAADIESFGVPVLVLGDPAQLPPVGGAGHYTREEPDILLEQIHRQALESPVLGLATRIRLSDDKHLGLMTTRGLQEWEVASVSRAMAADQILCWRNSTRWKLTDRIRTKLGRAAGVVDVGDRIICTVNNKKDLGVLNGQQFTVDAISRDNPWELLLTDDDGVERWIEVAPNGFQGIDGEAELKGMRLFRGGVMAATFSNVVTTHKAQGSEWDSVYVIDETPAMVAMTARREGETAAVEQARRWLYTAVTRARETVTLGRLRG